MARKKSSIRSIRRNELSRAAFIAVVRYGLRGTTLEKVGELAGVSKGVVLHHFKDKSALLEAVFRRSNALLSESVVELYKHANSPYERLWAIVFGNFFDTIFNRRVCQAWVSLISEVPHSKQCQRIQSIYSARIRSNLKHELRHFLSEEDCDRVTMQLALLIDGIWVRGGLSAEKIDSSIAISEMEYAISKMLPNDSISVKKHQDAKRRMETIASLVLNSKAFQEKSLQAGE
ncbi:MAG: transcriptional regulator BetI [Pseudomonadota bacterium]